MSVSVLEIALVLGLAAAIVLGLVVLLVVMTRRSSSSPTSRGNPPEPQ